ncbi:heparin lyase I family protein [Vibrio nitrifigilis]|uniref:Polysaccharide lyase n=1 Tax=Vibrio nitrifigilis TaxID=2789781 RepID=A0ABS0GCV3_9VIBR|nr:heparin lyase I family protein [Vibrio nitrifigilis]MBF9000243.1 polysaccharide lyase [Vibrio nitrifigilis]
MRKWADTLIKMLLFSGFGLVSTSVLANTDKLTTCPARHFPGAETTLHTFDANQWPLKGWLVQAPNHRALHLANDPTNKKNSVVRFELRHGETLQTRTVNRPRTELYEQYRAPFHHPIQYQFRVFFPNEWHSDNVRALIAQWHATPDLHLGEVSRSPNLALDVHGDQLLIKLQTSSVAVNHDNRTQMQRKVLYRSDPIKKNQWYQMKVDVNWSWSSDGYVKVWIQHQQVVNYIGPTAYQDCFGPYFKMGIYRQDSPNTFVMYADDYQRKRL